MDLNPFTFLLVIGWLDRGAKVDLDTQHEMEINKLIKDVETYKDYLKSSEARTSKKIKELSAEIKSLVRTKGTKYKYMLTVDF